MTQDDLETAGLSRVNFMTIETSESNPTGPDTVSDGVQVQFTITDENWDAAKASAANALVLVTWLESKRPE